MTRGTVDNTPPDCVQYPACEHCDNGRDCSWWHDRPCHLCQKEERLIEHDPMCRYKHMVPATDIDDPDGCDCPIIAAVRKQERERLADIFRERAIVAQNLAMAMEDQRLGDEFAHHRLSATAHAVAAGVWKQATEVARQGHWREQP